MESHSQEKVTRQEESVISLKSLKKRKVTNVLKCTEGGKALELSVTDALRFSKIVRKHSAINLYLLRHFQTFKLNFECPEKEVSSRRLLEPFKSIKTDSLHLSGCMEEEDGYYDLKDCRYLPIVFKTLTLTNFLIPDTVLEKILKRYYYTHTIMFESCCMDFGQLDLGKHIQYEIKEIKFDYCEFTGMDFAHESNGHYCRLFQAIAASSLKTSLQKMEFFYPMIPGRQLKRLAIQEGLKKVLIECHELSKNVK
ncbi:unnamed protein product [Moneuplotes crassus]|uniref:Uncharacterized protein n=1 Tax=Euplotes crassus TaxID=5936 RepID=A0AAD1XMA5_EUPCR|nr:unnamed protein product [Moneuplotes crassus]